MKKYIVKIILPVAAFIAMYACTKKDGVTLQAYDAYAVSATSGLLKVNLAVAYAADRTNMLIKLNGKTVSNLLQGRTPFPGGGYNTRGSNFAIYLSVPQGANTVSVVIPKTGTNDDSVVLFTGPVNIADNAPYTLHIADTMVSATLNNTKTLLVKNETKLVDTGFCRFRFVNLIPNLSAVDIYLNGTLVKSNVAYLAQTDTFSIRTGVNAPNFVNFSTPTWAVRPAGAASTTAAIATYASANGLINQGVLTMFTMGYGSTTGTRAPFVSFTLDKNQY